MRTLALGSLLAVLSACTVRATEPVAYVETTAAPVYVEGSPRTVYEGRDVYLVNNRWMYQDRGRWVYYRQEPPALYRQRTYVQSAPRAGRGGYYPAQPAPRSPQYAPPAGRR